MKIHHDGWTDIANAVFSACIISYEMGVLIQALANSLCNKKNLCELLRKFNCYFLVVDNLG